MLSIIGHSRKSEIQYDQKHLTHWAGFLWPLSTPWSARWHLIRLYHTSIILYITRGCLHWLVILCFALSSCDLLLCLPRYQLASCWPITYCWPILPILSVSLTFVILHLHLFHHRIQTLSAIYLQQWDNLPSDFITVFRSQQPSDLTLSVIRPYLSRCGRSSRTSILSRNARLKPSVFARSTLIVFRYAHRP